MSNLPLDEGERFILLAPGEQPPVLNRRVGEPQSESGHSTDEKCLCCCEESNSSILVVQPSLVTTNFVTLNTS